jgi:serine/threonine protein kinase
MFDAQLLTVREKLNMANEALQNYEAYQNTIVEELIDRHNTLRDRGNDIVKNDDDTEVTVDESTFEYGDSHSCFSLSSSAHSTSAYCNWRKTSHSNDFVYDNEQSFSLSNLCETLDESYSSDVNDWNIIRILGEGAFGQVVQVKRKTNEVENDNRCYALKMMSKYQIMCDGQIDVAIAEKTLLKKASSHPFIVKLRSAWQDTHLIYLLQDFVQGGELYSQMLYKDDVFVDADSVPTRRSLPEHQVQFYTACIADALHYLHRICKIVYRDLKPENILLDSNGYPVIIDLGLAKLLSEDNEYETRTLCGTPRYVAPEQIQGDGYSFGVDNWALGVLTYEMLTGLHPFDDWDGGNDIELYNSLVTEEYRPFSSSVTSISQSAKDFINSLLTKNPNFRLGNNIHHSDISRSEIQDHRWLSSLNVNDLRERNVLAPWIPELKNAEDSCLFDDWDSSTSKLIVDEKISASLTTKEQGRFAAFDSA